MGQQHLRVRRSTKHLQVLTGLFQQRQGGSIRLLGSQLGHQRIREKPQRSRSHVLVEKEGIHGIPEKMV